MTVYLSQTILFGIIFGVVPLLVTGRRLWMGQAAAALVALGVWLASVVLCAVLERGGHAGPFETLLRTAVARSERRRPTPPPPPAVWPGMEPGPWPMMQPAQPGVQPEAPVQPGMPPAPQPGPQPAP